jgi:hypothetical protein
LQLLLSRLLALVQLEVQSQQTMGVVNLVSQRQFDMRLFQGVPPQTPISKNNKTIFFAIDSLQMAQTTLT